MEAVVILEGCHHCNFGILTGNLLHVMFPEATALTNSLGVAGVHPQPGGSLEVRQPLNRQSDCKFA